MSNGNMFSKIFDRDQFRRDQMNDASVKFHVGGSFAEELDQLLGAPSRSRTPSDNGRTSRKPVYAHQPPTEIGVQKKWKYVRFIYMDGAVGPELPVPNRDPYRLMDAGELPFGAIAFRFHNRHAMLAPGNRLMISAQEEDHSPVVYPRGRIIPVEDLILEAIMDMLTMIRLAADGHDKVILVPNPACSCGQCDLVAIPPSRYRILQKTS